MTKGGVFPVRAFRVGMTTGAAGFRRQRLRTNSCRAESEFARPRMRPAHASEVGAVGKKVRARTTSYSMIPKSVQGFWEKIMLKNRRRATVGVASSAG